MAYEEGTAAAPKNLPLATGTSGKRYGVREIGGVNGTFVQNDSQRELIFDLEAGGPLAGTPMTAQLPANYLIEALYLEVEEAFAATSTADIVVSGGAGLTTDFVLSTKAALASVALTGMTLLSGTADTTITLTADAAAIASATGRARVVVQYKVV